MSVYNIDMCVLFSVLLILCFICPIQSSGLFSIQDTLTVVCTQFPLVSAHNNSDIQCARLRIDPSVPSFDFDLDSPTQLYLFFIIDPSSNISPANITINFYSLPDIPTPINEIRLGILVTDVNFTINNQISKEYTSFDIPIFRWRNSTETNTYDQIDLIDFDTDKYQTDTSLCKWNSNIWNRLFNTNTSTNVSYVYFLKTSSSQLNFTLVDPSNASSLLAPPSPYLNILYCIPYKLGVAEWILLICSSVFFIATLIIMAILHYFKGDDNRARHFERYYHYRRDAQDRFNSKKVRHRASVSVSSLDPDDGQT